MMTHHFHKTQLICFLAAFFMLCGKVADAQTLLKQKNIGRMGILPGNYSGITRINDTLYAVVNDKEKTEEFHLFTIDMNRKNGKIRRVSDKMVGSHIQTNRDMEGICYRPSSNTLFISDEASQRIREYSLEGIPTSKELNVPDIYGLDRIQSNRGFEALTYNDHTHLFWTTNESVLKADLSRNPPLLRIQSFDDNLQPSHQFLYELDPPLKSKKNILNHVHGVPSMIALDNGDLIVMERELTIPRRYIGACCIIKLYRVHPETTQPTTMLTKQFICQFKTTLRLGKMNFANYEGMCLGPTLDDGRQTIILINDSQNRMGNLLYRLKDYLKVIIL